ncbi:DUF5105 domain-containing protein [Carnobacterium maltaromaticum]|uniref:DUF5105 domain-containing protein n=1 Tax=Carnobacterium maltaromaticum TaxID=2751 RepID=UPI00191BA425|nr:DUF5105 domain-containing protein [Carnobacterium maltaromaticum]CAD5902893.1 exported hypothetical protein [Carnobacterium maltaromaticum]
MKQIKLLGVIVCFTLVLVACKKPEPANEATNILINGVIYNQKPGEITQLFTYNEPFTEYGESTLIANLKKSFELTDSFDKQLQVIADNLEKNLITKTSFQTRLLKESKGKAKVEISVIGLNEISDDELEKMLDTELEKKMIDISDESTEAEIHQLIDEISVNTLSMLVKEQSAKNEPNVLILDLIVDSNDSNKWAIQNEESFFIQLFEAFGN